VNLAFLEEAETEPIEAISRYESLEPGLGRRLRDEVVF
jgi:hypothetical protein